MKINGPNQSHFNPYKNHLQQQAKHGKTSNQKDQLQISSEAKQLQESVKGNSKRDTYVQEIKKAVESGDYQVNIEQTAEKMIAFWSKR